MENVYEIWTETYIKIRKLKGEKVANMFKEACNNVVPVNACSTVFLCQKVREFGRFYLNWEN